MKNYRALVLFICFLNCLQRAHSQQVVYSAVPPPPGGWMSYVVSISQDPNGYIWFGYKGVHRYDGYNYKSYFNNPLAPDSLSLSNNRIEAICADRNGYIWIATNRKGLDRLDPRSGVFKHYRYSTHDSNTISSDMITAIMEDHEGNIWLGTESAGLNCLDTKTGKTIRYRSNSNDSNSLSDSHINVLYQDKKGTIWIGTNTGGLNRFNPSTKNFTRFLAVATDPTFLIDNNVKVIYEDNMNRFWIGTANNGLHTMDREKGNFQRHLYNPAIQNLLGRKPSITKGKKTDAISFINEDAAGAIWIGTTEGGLNRYDLATETVSYYASSNEESATSNEMKSLWSGFKSKEGVIWMSGSEGVYRLDALHNQIPHFTIGHQVNCIMQDSHGNIWCGTDHGVVVYDSGRTLKKIISEKTNGKFGFKGDDVQSLYEDHNAIIWIGTSNGLNRYDPLSGKFRYYLPEKYIVSIYGDHKNSFWLGTNDGLILLDRERGDTTFYRHSDADPNSISQDHISHLMEDMSGNLWIGTEERGLNKFDSNRKFFQHFPPQAQYIKIYEDADSVLWIGSENGLYSLSRGEKNPILFTNEGAGLTKDLHIYQILEDDQRSVWVNTATGLFRIKPNRKDVVFLGKRFASATWAKQSNCFKGKNGQIFFGDNSRKGYYAFFPALLRENQLPPDLHLAFKLSNSTSRPLDKEDRISLDYNQNTFSFELAGIHFSDPENNRHIYMLENLDLTWRKANEEKTASYYGVPPGKYIFHVKVANSDGKEVEKSIVITIAPPWWRTWWAYCLYGVLALAIIYLAYRILRRRLLVAERERERIKEKAHAREIEQAYTELKSTQAQLIQSEKMASLGELTAGIAHEIQNPLNFINNFSDINKELVVEVNREIAMGNLAEAQSLLDTLGENEQKINHHGKKADAIVKGMLQHSKSSTGHKEPTEINALAAEYLRLAYHGYRSKDKSFNADLLTSFDQSAGTVNVVPQEIGRVLLNICNNAFYAVSEKKKMLGDEYKPQISLATEKYSGKIRITIRDNGNGIPENIVGKIFQPFFTTKPTGQGTGLGLSLSYDIVKSHSGEILLNSKNGEGSEFSIYLPK